MTTDQIPRFDYASPPTAATQIFEWLEEHIDLDHMAAVNERRIKALQWEPVDRPPVTFSAPVEEPLSIYPYSEAYRDPTKMLVNELIGPYANLGYSPSIFNSVLIKDDFPLQIRANYGVGLFVSLFGAKIEQLGDNFPWTRPIGIEALKRHVTRGVPELNSDLFQRVRETLAYYKEVMAPYPRCRQAIRITQPDLQGPFENACHLWGSSIFTYFYDDPTFLREVLDLLAETWIRGTKMFAAESTETVRDNFIYLHFTILKGRGIIKEDSCIMLSTKHYADFIKPMNEKVFRGIGTGGIHWCGKGDQWRSQIASTEGLTCLDWGNPNMMDMAEWASVLREHRLPVAKMEWKARAFQEEAPTRHFPTGGCFSITVDSLDQARAILRNMA